MLFKNKKYLLIIGTVLLLLVGVNAYLIYIGYLKNLFLNLMTEIIGIIITVFLIDFLLEKQKQLEFDKINKFVRKKIFGIITGFYFHIILLAGYPLVDRRSLDNKPIEETSDKEIVEIMDKYVSVSYEKVKKNFESYFMKFNIKQLKELKKLIESSDKNLNEIFTKEGSKLDVKVVELIMLISENVRRIGITYLTGFLEIKSKKERGIQLNSTETEIINRSEKAILEEFKQLFENFEKLRLLVK